MGDSSPPVSTVSDLLKAEFEAIKAIYPRRDGDQRWKRALTLYCSARRKGESFEQIRDGVGRYSEWCKQRELVGTEKTKQAATFFGPEESWREAWPPFQKKERGFVG